MEFHSAIEKIERIIFFLGLIPVKYSSLEKRYICPNILWNTILKFLLLNSVYFYLVTFVNHREKSFITYNLSHISKFVWFFYEIVQSIELKFKQKKYCLVLNKILLFNSDEFLEIMFFEKIKIQNKIYLFVLLTYFIICCSVFLYVAPLRDIIMAFYYNVYNFSSLMKTIYILNLLKILSNQSKLRLRNIIGCPANIVSFSSNFAKIQKMIRQFTNINELHLTMQILATMAQFGCTIYMFYEKILTITKTQRSARLNEIFFYVFFDNLPLSIIFYLCWRYHEYVNQVGIILI